MATLLSRLRTELTATLDEVFNDAYNSDPPWAVFFTYYHDTMTTQIHDVVPWEYGKHKVRSGLFKVHAKDELDAYTKVLTGMEQTEGR